MYEVFFTKSALKDVELLKAAKLAGKAKALVEIIQKNPFQSPPPFERLRGSLSSYCSRRINIQHRLVYRVDEEKKQIIIASLWSHYENM